jgi:hypothetical protein
MYKETPLDSLVRESCCEWTRQLHALSGVLPYIALKHNNRDNGVWSSECVKHARIASLELSSQSGPRNGNDCITQMFVRQVILSPFFDKNTQDA